MNNPFQSVVRNNVLPLSILKKMNYPLFRYYMKNRNELKRRFKSEGIDVLNDIRTKNTYTNIKLYLRYRFGGTVNMNVLREKERTVYNYLSLRGIPREVVEEMGFVTEYALYKREMDYITAELSILADDENYIYKMGDPVLYGKIKYRAKKEGLSVVVYLENLGFHYGLNIERLLHLHKQGFSKKQIAQHMSISTATVTRELAKVRDIIE